MSVPVWVMKGGNGTQGGGGGGRARLTKPTRQLDTLEGGVCVGGGIKGASDALPNTHIFRRYVVWERGQKMHGGRHSGLRTPTRPDC